MELEFYNIKYYVCLALALLVAADAAKILAVHTIEAKSHFWFHHSVLKSLASAGHHVTMIAPFSPPEFVENLTVVDSRIDKTKQDSPFAVQDFKNVPWFLIIAFGYQIFENDCYNFMKLAEVQNILKSEEKLFDVMFLEVLLMHQCYLPLANKFNIPVIGTLSVRSCAAADQSVGNSRNRATIPFELSNRGTKMTFFERVVNVMDEVLMDLIIYFLESYKLEKYYSQYYPNSDVNNPWKVSLIFANNHPSMLPRADVPNMINVGGIHVKSATWKVIPENIRTFIEESQHGVILFSLGTLATSVSIGVELRNVFKAAFAQIPQRVIWKFDRPVEDLSDNVLLLDWMPQKEILGHPNVTAFISHCGMASTYEAVYAGKPMVALPVTFDQHTNAALLEELGVGVHADITSLTKEKLLRAIDAAVNDTKYSERMRKLSRAFKDDPIAPAEQVVYWTEYVLRHNGTSSLRTAAADMPSYQYLLLDVIAFLVVVTAVVPFAIYWSRKRICIRVLCGKRKTNLSDKKIQ